MSNKKDSSPQFTIKLQDAVHELRKCQVELHNLASLNVELDQEWQQSVRDNEGVAESALRGQILDVIDKIFDIRIRIIQYVDFIKTQ